MLYYTLGLLEAIVETLLPVVQTYDVPVLLSGLAPLVLSSSEEGLIDKHHKEVILNIQRPAL